MRGAGLPSGKAMRNRARELRQEQTAAERRLWHALRERRVGEFKFRRQVPIDRFIADFYCARSRLIVEVDGGVHDSEEQRQHDEARTAVLEAAGYRVIRFSNSQVEEQLPAVLRTILHACLERQQ